MSLRSTLKKKSLVLGKRVGSVVKSSMLEVTSHRNFDLKKNFFSYRLFAIHYHVNHGMRKDN